MRIEDMLATLRAKNVALRTRIATDPSYVEQVAQPLDVDPTGAPNVLVVVAQSVLEFLAQKGNFALDEAETSRDKRRTGA